MLPSAVQRRSKESDGTLDCCGGIFFLLRLAALLVFYYLVAVSIYVRVAGKGQSVFNCHERIETNIKSLYCIFVGHDGSGVQLYRALFDND